MQHNTIYRLEFSSTALKMLRLTYSKGKLKSGHLNKQILSIRKKYIKDMQIVLGHTVREAAKKVSPLMAKPSEL